MPVPPLTLRIPTGRPLTAGEVDGNFTILLTFANGLEARVNVSLDANGNLKAGALNLATMIADGVITGIKLVDQTVTSAKIASAVAGNGLLKVLAADPISVNVDNVTLAFDGSVPPKLIVKAGGIGIAQAGAGVASGSHVMIVDEQGAGADAGTFTQTVWQTRVLQTIKRNVNSSLITLTSNQIKLKAGTYRCHVVAPALACVLHKARLRNVSSSTTLIVGTNARSDASDSTTSNSVIYGYFTVADDNQLLEVQHQCSQTKTTTGFGAACNMGESEIYTIAEFWKEA